MNIHPTAIIDPGAELAEDVTVGPYSIIHSNVTVGRGTTIGSHVVIKPFVKIGEYNDICQFSSIGEVPQDLKYHGEDTWLIIGDRNRIREFVTFNRGTVGGGGETRIGSDGLYMAYTHVAHDCTIGDNVILANSLQMGGHVQIEDYAIVGGGSVMHQFIRVGEHSMIGGGSALPQDVPPYTVAVGNRASLHGLNLVGLQRRGFSPEAISSLKKAYRLIFRSKIPFEEAKRRIGEEVEMTDEVGRLIDFIERSERGIIR